jgi:hypothetical protein
MQIPFPFRYSGTEIIFNDDLSSNCWKSVSSLRMIPDMYFSIPVK